MQILTVNTGSTSIKLCVVEADHESVRCSPGLSRSWHNPERQPEELLHEFLTECVVPIDAVAHRVVHGGAEFQSPRRITPEVADRILALGALAPLHNPRAHHWLRACKALLGPSLPQVAVFDTAFFARLPEPAAQYALPRDLTTRFGIRRYGFHGIAHSAMYRHWRDLRAKSNSGDRIITLQLGGGCSAAAIRDGHALDTSMGFSPIEGLVMAGRPGDLDPGIISFLLHNGYDSMQLDELLNRQGGLSGLAGSADMRELLKREDEAAALAVELFCHRLRKYIGAYMAVLGGCDGVLFGGGIGENAPEIRRRVLEPFRWTGLDLDSTANGAAVGGNHLISTDRSAIEVRAVRVDEAAQLAVEALALLQP